MYLRALFERFALSVICKMLFKDEVRMTTIPKGTVLKHFVWPWPVVKIGASSAAMTNFEPPMVKSISRQWRRILAIHKMLLVDGVKDYYRIEGHCS